MGKYLLIESRVPFDCGDVGYYYDLATGLAASGNTVTLFLAQNGVLAARPSARSGALAEVADGGVKVLADEFSLRKRGIADDRLIEGVAAAPLDIVIDHLADESKAMWH